MVVLPGVGDQSPHQEGRHDGQVVQGEPVRLPQSHPLCAADAENTQGEGDLVDHLHLVHLLLFSRTSGLSCHFHGREDLPFQFKVCVRSQDNIKSEIKYICIEGTFIINQMTN